MATFYTGVDQQRYDAGEKFLPMNRFLLNYTAPNTNVEEEVTTSYGLPNTNAFTQSSVGGGGGGPFDPYTAKLNQGDFVTNRTNYSNTGYIQGTEPEEDYAQKIGGMIKTGIGMAIPGGNFLMNMAENQSRQNRLNASDNAFIDRQLGIQEKNIHGIGNLTNQDRYGYNKESMFGNYGDLVKERVETAKGFIDFNHPDADEDGFYRDIDKYYNEKAKEQFDIEKQINFNNWMNQRMTANKIRAGAFKNPDGTDIYSGTNIHGGDGAATTKAPTTPTSIGVSLHGGDSGSNIPDRNRGRDRGRDRDKGETGQIAGGHHFRYGGLASIL